ncbi:MAG: aldo/keto reductase [Saccharofermentanales bacterium]|jgi:aryl-alcohol dehydrogenase-like predicted oxidoreductase
MRYKTLGKTGISVSEVGLGTWAMGSDYFGHTDDEQSIAAIRSALDAGINLIDTAPAYGSGHAEEIVGRALAGRRDEAVITTKCGTIRNKQGVFVRDLSFKGLQKQLDDSLRRLQVDVIDIYLFHWPDPATPDEEAAESIAKLKETGKFKHFGVSNFTLEQIDIIDKIIPVEVLQPAYSILDRRRAELIEKCAERDIGVMTYGSLAGGLLTGKFKEKPEFAEADTRENFYPFFKDRLWDKSMAVLKDLQVIADERGRTLAELAINFVSQDPNISTALVGAKTPAQVEANAGASGWKLTNAERRRINESFERNFGGTTAK